MTNLRYTVVLSPVDPSLHTPWHPVTTQGPFATLTRGIFDSVEKAYDWAAEKGIQAGFRVRAVDWQENN